MMTRSFTLRGECLRLFIAVNPEDTLAQRNKMACWTAPPRMKTRPPRMKAWPPCDETTVPLRM